MFWVKINTETNELLHVSEEEILTVENSGCTVLIFQEDLPDLTEVEWEGNTLRFVKKSKIKLSKIEFRRLFTLVEQMNMDEFNDNYNTLEYLTNDQKKLIRTGLKNYNEATTIELTDPYIPMLLDLYIAVGILTEERKIEILGS